MALARDVKQKALDVGFTVVGITHPEMLHGLPYGWVGKIANLRTPEQEFPDVRSVVLAGVYAWDRAFNLATDSSKLQGEDFPLPRPPLEGYQLYYEIVKVKAWRVVDYLAKKGFNGLPTVSIPLKTSAVKCGIGCQGKNTLLITPTHGPRVRLAAILTNAELEADEPFEENLCRDCDKCVQVCPTHALEPYKLTITRCLTYSLESPDSSDVSEEVRIFDRKLIERPTPHSYIECSICLEVCPIGKKKVSELEKGK